MWWPGITQLHALVGLERPRRGQLDRRADAQLVAVRPAAKLDRTRANGELLARLAHPGQPQHVVAAELPGEDRRERLALLLATALVDVDDEAPRRAGLVVVVPDREGGCEPAEIDPVRMALADEPGEDAHADPVGRAAARDTANRPAGADRLAVAGFEVVTLDVPAHRGVGP